MTRRKRIHNNNLKQQREEKSCGSLLPPGKEDMTSQSSVNDAGNVGSLKPLPNGRYDNRYSVLSDDSETQSGDRGPRRRNNGWPHLSPRVKNFVQSMCGPTTTVGITIIFETKRNLLTFCLKEFLEPIVQSWNRS